MLPAPFAATECNRKHAGAFPVAAGGRLAWQGAAAPRHCAGPAGPAHGGQPTMLQGLLAPLHLMGLEPKPGEWWALSLLLETLPQYQQQWLYLLV